MAARLDAVQIALPKTVVNAQEQHAALRHPIVAQEQAAVATRNEARAQEERPAAVSHPEGGKVRQERHSDVPAAEPWNGSRRPRPERLPQRSATKKAAATSEDEAPAEETAASTGARLDVRL